MKTFKCTRCGNSPSIYIELWKDHTICFGVTDGKVEQEGSLGVGHPYGVEAQCECGHAWRLRGILQITDVQDIIGVYNNE